MNLFARWERRLRADGLAPVDQTLRGRTIVRTEIITPKRRYLPEPERLADALERWLAGDASHFDQCGRAMLAKETNQCDGRWPRRRARVLLRVCVALGDGMTVHEAAPRRGDQDLAYAYLRPLYGCLLAEVRPLFDDDDSGDGGTTGD